MYKLRDRCWQVSYFLTSLFGLCLVNQRLEIVKTSSWGKVIVSQLEWWAMTLCQIRLFQWDIHRFNWLVGNLNGCIGSLVLQLPWRVGGKQSFAWKVGVVDRSGLLHKLNILYCWIISMFYGFLKTNFLKLVLGLWWVFGNIRLRRWAIGNVGGNSHLRFIILRNHLHIILPSLVQGVISCGDSLTLPFPFDIIHNKVICVDTNLLWTVHTTAQSWSWELSGLSTQLTVVRSRFQIR